MKKNLFQSFLFSFLTFFASQAVIKAQDISRARKVVKELASPFYHGRGYVYGGDSLAADFLAKEFRLAGLQPLNNSYFQSFTFPVNTFPGKMEVKLGRKELVAGKDFILGPSSTGVKGKYRVLRADSCIFAGTCSTVKQPDKTAVLYPQEWRKQFSKQPLAARFLSKFPVRLEIVPKKLTYSVAGEVSSHTSVQIPAEKLPSEMKYIRLNIENKFIPSHHARNVIGFLEGTSKKDSFLVITAHYDHLGRLGSNAYFPGANDNASGIAMLLELARYFSGPADRLPYSLLFIGFAGEEAGLLGSQYYVENPILPLSSIRFLINLDLLGSGSEGITVVNGSVFTRDFSVLDSLNRSYNLLPKMVARGKAANSDHYPFSEKGVPAFFIYTMGEITAYHDVDDKPEVVTFSRFSQVFSLLTSFIKHF